MKDGLRWSFRDPVLAKKVCGGELENTDIATLCRNPACGPIPGSLTLTI